MDATRPNRTLRTPAAALSSSGWPPSVGAGVSPPAGCVGPIVGDMEGTVGTDAALEVTLGTSRPLSTDVGSEAAWMSADSIATERAEPSPTAAATAAACSSVVCATVISSESVYCVEQTGMI